MSASSRSVTCDLLDVLWEPAGRPGLPPSRGGDIAGQAFVGSAGAGEIVGGPFRVIVASG